MSDILKVLKYSETFVCITCGRTLYVKINYKSIEIDLFDVTGNKLKTIYNLQVNLSITSNKFLLV